MSTITLLFPFDHGHSYLLPPETDWKKIITSSSSMPNGDVWLAFSDVFTLRAPLGSPLCLKLNPYENDIATAIKSLPFCKDPFDASVIFYPTGIGLLVIRAQVSVSSIKQREDDFRNWEEKAYNGLFESVAQRSSLTYRKLIQKYKIPEIHEVDRSYIPIGFPWIYAIFFDNLRSGKINDVLAKSDIDWFRANVYISPTVDKARIEKVFITASAVWQMLHITDILLDKVLYDLLYKQQAKGHFHSANFKSSEDFRIFRGFCARIIDSCNTMRWTILEDEIKILNQIHSVWKTEMWQKSVGSKTDLLALLYEQNQEGRTERRNFWFTVIAFILTISRSKSGLQRDRYGKRKA